MLEYKGSGRGEMGMKKNKVEEEVNYFFDYLIGIFLSYYQVMVIKT